MFRDRYAHVWEGSERWKGIAAGRSVLYAWDGTSTYIQSPPFFEDLTLTRQAIRPITNLRVLGLFGDSVTTDHISPAGDIAPESPAGRYLLSIGVPREAWNTYGSRRGNHEVMMRGTFGNIRIKNRLVQGKEGNVTIHYPSGEEMSFFEAAERYRREGTPLLILAGKEYGSGSSRDWAAKGPYLLGVRVVLAEGYERIHRSNLIGMGILPLQFLPGKTASDMGLSGDAFFDVHVDDSLRPGQRVQVSVTKDKKQTFEVLSRIDTPIEVEYYRNGGILQTVLKNMPQDAG
jgi:aconitate hydratase